MRGRRAILGLPCKIYVVCTSWLKDFSEVLEQLSLKRFANRVLIDKPPED